ncbi:hypothetical protein CPU12_13040 [Malaciobacter molluscorum LMG 25693]|uniref:Membrane protein n=1 Tax=Malaciobacter molluscorum LMG 25693 TaxID=870501 RepID=A0A2G1DEP9_9BACT|nr:hypothetical protein [Malaciobacter molluscorum]AXX93065.1 putative membrane protein [Malaciobacter molluscorum LMG 25693]PHO16967.1 hypothetical protein CPU12_13040 [Malaciobacter molluscorum LMG 25693]RXJ95536.1 hypothetical protein CRV00_03580 [Malaciobacter molluscorum]
MQIILFVLVIIILLAIIYQKLRKRYSLKTILGGTIVLIILISISIYISSISEGGIKKAFIQKYKKEFGYKISKLTATMATNNETRYSNEYYYKFVYIVNKNKKEYVCEANNVFVQLIEDEYVFKTIKEECREK